MSAFYLPFQLEDAFKKFITRVRKGDSSVPAGLFLKDQVKVAEYLGACFEEALDNKVVDPGHAYPHSLWQLDELGFLSIVSPEVGARMGMTNKRPLDSVVHVGDDGGEPKAGTGGNDRGGWGRGGDEGTTEVTGGSSDDAEEDGVKKSSSNKHCLADLGNKFGVVDGQGRLYQCAFGDRCNFRYRASRLTAGTALELRRIVRLSSNKDSVLRTGLAKAIRAATDLPK